MYQHLSIAVLFINSFNARNVGASLIFNEWKQVSPKVSFQRDSDLSMDSASMMRHDTDISINRMLSLSNTNPSYMYQSLDSSASYDEYQLAWRLLGYYVDCGSTNDNGSGCPRKTLYAVYVDQNYQGGGIGEYTYYDESTKEYICYDNGSCRAKMDCHSAETDWELLGIFKIDNISEDNGWMEQLFKHEGVCVWGENTYEFASDMRGEIPTSCTVASDQTFDENGNLLYFDTKPAMQGSLTLGLYTDALCSKEYIGNKTFDVFQLADADESSWESFNEALNVYKQCQPCIAYDLSVSGFDCDDEAGYTNCNQCMKFSNKAGSEAASKSDIILAARQLGLVSVQINGVTYSRFSTWYSAENTIEIKALIAQSPYFAASICFFLLGLIIFIFTALMELIVEACTTSSRKKRLCDGDKSIDLLSKPKEPVLAKEQMILVQESIQSPRKAQRQRTIMPSEVDDSVTANSSLKERDGKLVDLSRVRPITSLKELIVEACTTSSWKTRLCDGYKSIDLLSKPKEPVLAREQMMLVQESIQSPRKAQRQRTIMPSEVDDSVTANSSLKERDGKLVDLSRVRPITSIQSSETFCKARSQKSNIALKPLRVQSPTSIQSSESLSEVRSQKSNATSENLKVRSLLSIKSSDFLGEVRSQKSDITLKPPRVRSLPSIQSSKSLGEVRLQKSDKTSKSFLKVNTMLGKESGTVNSSSNRRKVDYSATVNSSLKKRDGKLVPLSRVRPITSIQSSESLGEVQSQKSNKTSKPLRVRSLTSIQSSESLSDVQSQKSNETSKTFFKVNSMSGKESGTMNSSLSAFFVQYETTSEAQFQKSIISSMSAGNGNSMSENESVSAIPALKAFVGQQEQTYYQTIKPNKSSSLSCVKKKEKPAMMVANLETKKFRLVRHRWSKRHVLNDYEKKDPAGMMYQI